MCDQDSMDDVVRYQLRQRELSRRQFGALGVGAGLVSMLPRAADAAEVKESEVVIKTPDGSCDAHFAHPVSGKAPAVLVWPDIFGLRPAFKQMGRRLAENGYAVLTVNPFYRKRKHPTAPEKPNFGDPATREMLMGLMGSLTPQTQETDAKAFVAWLDGQAPVDRAKKIGTTGYCMGGPIVMRTAAAVPDRIGAGASFHGAGLASDAPMSPHLLIPKMKAQFLVAIADNDDQKTPQEKTLLREAFDKAGLKAEIEVYKGAMHGWVPGDSQAYNAEASEKAWARKLALFKAALA